MIYVYEKCGRKRRGVEVVCPQCNSTFITRADKQQGKYCSKSCSHKARSNKVTIKCDQCNKDFQKRPSAVKNSKHGYHFCSRACKDTAQSAGGVLQDVMPDNYGNGYSSNSQYYREKYRKEHGITKLSCTRCGYNEFECGVEIHHIDHNNQNNDIDNLLSVCACCHRGLHYNEWQLEELSLKYGR